MIASLSHEARAVLAWSTPFVLDCLRHNEARLIGDDIVLVLIDSRVAMTVVKVGPRDRAALAVVEEFVSPLMIPMMTERPANGAMWLVVVEARSERCFAYCVTRGDLEVIEARKAVNSKGGIA